MDTLVTVPEYPTEDTKMRASASKQAGGGPVGTGLVAVSKLGCEAGYIGVVSNDGGGQFLMQDFQKYGVDTGAVLVEEGYRSFTSIIWLSEKASTRTCVFDKGNLPPLQLDEKQKMTVKEAALLMVDGNEFEAAVEAAKLANENGAKVLYDAGGRYEGVERLLTLTDILIPSEEFALGYSGCDSVEEAAKWLYDAYKPEVVVITQGVKGGVIFDGENLQSYPSFPVKAIDTNGAGDVFHGAFAAGVMKGFTYKECCIFASAVSAIKCTGVGARESVPDFETVKQFLKEKGYEL